MASDDPSTAPKGSARTRDNLPRRLIIAGEPGGPIEIYNDDREFLGRGRIAQAPPPGGVKFVRADIADEDRRKLEKLACAAKGVLVIHEAADIPEQDARWKALGDAAAEAQTVDFKD